MWLVFFFVAQAEICDEFLEGVVEREMKPRIEAYVAQGQGLDYVEPISKCKSQENSTYALFTWGKNQMNLIGFGFCLPEVCKDRVSPYLSEHAQSSISKIYSKENDLVFIDLKAKSSLSSPAIFFIFMFVLLVLFTLLGTLTNLGNSEFFNCFDYKHNFKSMFKFSPDPENFEFFDGIRAICCSCILLLHDYIFMMGLPLRNRKEYNDNINSLFTTWVRSFNYGVDIFFYIAGFLMAVLTIREVYRKGDKFSIWACVVRRLGRYLPVYLFIIGVDRCFVKDVPGNSRSIISFIFMQGVQGGWWKNLLFVHNAFTEGKTPYLAWTWSVAADFQFYVVSVFIVFLYSKSKSLAYLGLMGLCAVCSVVNYLVAYEHDLKPANLNQMEMRQYGLNYSAPIPRIAPFMIGVMLGLVYNSGIKGKVSLAYQVQDSLGERFEKKCLTLITHTKLRYFLYILGLSFMMFPHIVAGYCGLYGADVLSKDLRSIYYSIYKLIFTIGFSFFAFPMSLGYLQSIKNLLSIFYFRYLGRISYTFFLIHPFFFALMNFRGDDLFEATKTVWAINSSILYIISIILSGIVYALIECPIQRALRNYLPR